MSLFECFSCDDSFATSHLLQQHLWKAHLSKKRQSDGACPICDGALLQSNAPHHFPCFFDITHAELEIFEATSKRLCPICDRPKSSEGLHDHLLSHSVVEWAEVLGNNSSCGHCGEDVESVMAHLSCLHTSTSSNPGSDGAHTPCPAAGCENSFSIEGKLLWHIWRSHFNADGERTECPGCSRSITLGNLPQHLVCVESLDKRISQFFPPLGKTCYICDLSVLNTDVLYRHFHGKHLRGGRRCPDCGGVLSGDIAADVDEHLACLARAEGETPLKHLDQRWPCPSCGKIHNSRTSLRSHVEDQHLQELVGDTTCAVCEETMSTRSQHIDCLLGNASTTDSKAAPKRISPVQSVDADGYFSELFEFVSREREAEREQNLEQYRTNSIEHLASQKRAIPELICVGEQYHPKFDTQLIYERPVGEDETADELDSLADRYGIYPYEIVLVGTDQRDSALPQPGTVTFVDEQTIGVAFPELSGNLSSTPLRNLNQDDRTYHVAKLLNPKPYDAEKKAISDVRNDSRLRNLVLGNTAQTGTPMALPSIATRALNEYQTNAVERALGTEEVVCIHGPPGTGKTRTLRYLIRLTVSLGQRVLAASHSNQAIDNLLVGTSTPREPDPNSLHYVATPASRDRFLPPELQDALDSDDEDEQALATAYLNRPRELSIARLGYNSSNAIINRQYAAQRPADADLVAGTMGSISSAADEMGEFDLVIIDEAGQAAQPPTFIPVTHAGTIVLAGDHLQLPPYVADEEAKEEQMHISLFEHLLDVYGEEIAVLLRRQYRMNQMIAAFPNEHVYGGKIETGEQNRDWTVDSLQPIMAVDMTTGEETPPGSNSKRNPAEAKMVANHVKLLLDAGLEASEIGVITPYTGQIRSIKSATHSLLGPLCGLKVATVDSFQGAQREAIIVSWVRSNEWNNSGFLSFPEEGKRRLNVAMTRARKRLVLIGDWNTLGTPGRHEDPAETCSELFAELYQWLNTEGLVKHI